MSQSLRDIQLAFAADIVRPDGGPVRGSYLRKGGGVFASEQLINVYRNNYRLSLTAALKSSYAAVARLVGDEFFAYLAHNYIREFPLHSGDLLNFGDSFASFISSLQALKNYPYLEDVARLERLYEVAYHARETSALDLESLANVTADDSENVVLSTHDSVGILRSRYPIYDIWTMEEDSAEVSLSDAGQNILIFRHDLAIRVALPDDRELSVLEAVRENKTLGSICKDGLLDDDFDLQSFIIKYARLQVFNGFRVAVA